MAPTSAAKVPCNTNPCRRGSSAGGTLASSFAHDTLGTVKAISIFGTTSNVLPLVNLNVPGGIAKLPARRAVTSRTRASARSSSRRRVNGYAVPFIVSPTETFSIGSADSASLCSDSPTTASSPPKRIASPVQARSSAASSVVLSGDSTERGNTSLMRPSENCSARSASVPFPAVRIRASLRRPQRLLRAAVAAAQIDDQPPCGPGTPDGGGAMMPVMPVSDSDGSGDARPALIRSAGTPAGRRPTSAVCTSISSAPSWARRRRR